MYNRGDNSGKARVQVQPSGGKQQRNSPHPSFFPVLGGLQEFVDMQTSATKMFLRGNIDTLLNCEAGVPGSWKLFDTLYTSVSAAQRPPSAFVASSDEAHQTSWLNGFAVPPVKAIERIELLVGQKLSSGPAGEQV